MRALIFVFLFAFTTSIFCQTDTLKSSTPHIKKELNPFKRAFLKVDSMKVDSINSIYGLVEIKDPQIDLLIQDYMDNKKLMGYRIQIFSSDRKANAMAERIKFINFYPNLKSYLVYQAPNFKVRVGDYTDRLEVHKELVMIHENFPGAFIVKDEIEPIVK